VRARRFGAAAGYGFGTFGGALLLAAAGFAAGRWI